MKSVLITGHGGPEVVEVRNTPVPERKPGCALVRMHAATLNRVDLYMRNSGAGITHQLPQVMGLDGAGVVHAVESGESRLSVGQSVCIHPALMCGRCEFCLRGEGVLCTHIRYLGEHCDGTFTEWLNVPVTNLFPMPRGLSYMQAAALGVNHLTAWRMLFTKAQLRAGETVLIFGVGGGVSLAALQLAHAAGARTIVTSRKPDKLERAIALGADFTIDSSTQDVVRTVMDITQGRGVDVVIENIGGDMWPLAMKSLCRGGRLVTCGATQGDQPPADIRRIFIRQLQILGSTLGDLNDFQNLLRCVEQSNIRPVIDSEFDIDDIHAAMERLESGDQFGKVGLRLLQS